MDAKGSVVLAEKLIDYDNNDDNDNTDNKKMKTLKWNNVLTCHYYGKLHTMKQH